MKKPVIILSVLILIMGAFLLINSTDSEVCAGSKCHFNMVCGGNANIKAVVCASDCNSSSTKEKAKQWFKKKCSSASTPSNSHWGWKNCDVKL